MAVPGKGELLGLLVCRAGQEGPREHRGTWLSRALAGGTGAAAAGGEKQQKHRHSKDQTVPGFAG